MMRIIICRTCEYFDFTIFCTGMGIMIGCAFAMLSIHLHIYVFVFCVCVAASVQAKDGEDRSNDRKTPPPPFSSDLFIRRVHLLVGEVLEPLWRDPRLPSLPQEAASRVLTAVLELMQSLQVCAVVELFVNV